MIIPGFSLDYLAIILTLSLNYPLIILGLTLDYPGLSLDFPGIIHRLSQDCPLTFPSLYLDYPGMIPQLKQARANFCYLETFSLFFFFPNRIYRGARAPKNRRTFLKEPPTNLLRFSQTLVQNQTFLGIEV